MSNMFVEKTVYRFQKTYSLCCWAAVTLCRMNLDISVTVCILSSRKDNYFFCKIWWSFKFWAAIAYCLKTTALNTWKVNHDKRAEWKNRTASEGACPNGVTLHLKADLCLLWVGVTMLFMLVTLRAGCFGSHLDKRKLGKVWIMSQEFQWVLIVWRFREGSVENNIKYIYLKVVTCLVLKDQVDKSLACI